MVYEGTGLAAIHAKPDSSLTIRDSSDGKSGKIETSNAYDTLYINAGASLAFESGNLINTNARYPVIYSW